MRLTVDATVFFSALLKEGVTRRLWFNPRIDLIAPEFLLVEFKKYRSELQERFASTMDDFETLTHELFFRVRFVKDEELEPYLPAAAFLVQDAKDWIYLACALKENTALWSNDAELKKQSRVLVKTTTELLDEEKGL